MKTVTRFVAAMALVGSAGVANASLVGDTVDCAFTGGTHDCDLGSAIVGAGSEFQILDALTPLANIDVGDSSVTLTAVSDFFGSGILTLSDLDWVNGPGQIVGVNLISGTVGLDDSDLSFTVNSLSIDLAGTQWRGPANGGSSATIELITSHVPLPAAAWLFISALGGLVVAKRKQLKA